MDVAITLLLGVLHEVRASSLNRTAITCYVCSTTKSKTCNDPIDENAHQTVPYFDCSRLFGVFDDQQESFQHFRPTRPDKATTIPTSVQNTSTTTVQPTNTTQVDDDSNFIKKQRHRANNSNLNDENPEDSEDVETGRGIWQSIVGFNELFKRHHRKGPLYELADQYNLEPFLTQGIPGGVKEAPKHFCYKLLINGGDIVERGCTNVTTRQQACSLLNDTPNITFCTTCELNFCNGIEGTIKMRNFEIIGALVVVGLVTNKQ